jgi:glycerol-3-phosphate dehydrogenase
VPGDAKELSQPLCGHRPFLVAELVHALQHLGAVTFSDVMLRRLVHVLGPCLEDACLRRAHQWFMRERRHLVDDEPALAVAALQAEVREMTGDLEAWRTGTI